MGISFTYNKNLKPLAKELRKARNLAEALIWRELKNKNFCGMNFDRQKPIGRFIADFCCEKSKIILEIDGSSHLGRDDLDAERDAYLDAAGFKTIRIQAEDVKYNLDLVLQWLEKEVRRLRAD